MLSRKTSRFLIRSWIEAIASSASVGGLVASWARDNGVAKKQQVAMTRAACANVFATVARTVLGADGLWILKRSCVMDRGALVFQPESSGLSGSWRCDSSGLVDGICPKLGKHHLRIPQVMVARRKDVWEVETVATVIGMENRTHFNKDLDADQEPRPRRASGNRLPICNFGPLEEPRNA